MAVAALAATLLVAAACSSPQGTEQAESSRLGKGKDRGAGAANGKGKAGGGRKNDGRKPGRAKKPRGGGIPAAPGAVVASPGEGGGKGFDPSTKTKTEVAAQGQDPASATVLVTEPDPDAEKSGITPQYGDIVSTEVAGTARDVRVTIRLHAALPDKMPDDKTYMVLGFGLTPPKGQQQGYAFGASADSKGWTAYGGDKKGGRFEGEFSISGDTAVFTIPWSAVKGPRPFEWYAQTSWFKSLAGTTHYSLDALPNDGPAKYPAG